MKLDDLERAAPQGLDLKDAAHLEAVDALTDALLNEYASDDDLAALEAERTTDDSTTSLAMQLAIKVARSRRFVERYDDPVKLSVMFAMYKEHNRLRPPSEHPNGEDALVRKMAQLDRLVAGQPNWSWELLVVDDGCPNDSGKVAEAIVERHGRGDQVRVLYLADAIRSGSKGAGTLSSVDESRKGGSIHLALWEAAADTSPGHVALFTDADLSTHLGQCGSLAAPILEGGAAMSIGSRREARSVVVKTGGRNDRGKLFIYLWKRVLGPLGGVTDTQCGFKAFDVSHVREWVDATIEKGFAFDIELLLQARNVGPNAIARVPVAWIDSEAESTTTDLQPYLAMLQAVAKMYRHHLSATPEQEAFAKLIEALDEDAWQRLLLRIPDEITDREPSQFDQAGELVSAGALLELSRIRLFSP